MHSSSGSHDRSAFLSYLQSRPWHLDLSVNSLVTVGPTAGLWCGPVHNKPLSFSSAKAFRGSTGHSARTVDAQCVFWSCCMNQFR